MRTFLILLAFASTALAEYSLPAGRSITWNPAGMDVTGGIPTSYTTTTPVTGLVEGGLVDMTTTIQTFINAASADTLLTLPAGVYLIEGTLQMKSGVTLRGAKKQGGPPYLPTADAAATTLKLDSNGYVYFDGGDKGSSWTPGAQSGLAITSGYTQGSTSLTLASVTGLNVDDYIAVYQNEDATWIDDKGFTWLGEDSGGDPHVWCQYTKITAINSLTLTIDPPLYQVTPSPTGQSVRGQDMGIENAGLENLRIDNSASPGIRIISMDFAAHCWVSGVETYMSGNDGSGSPHYWIEFCYGLTIANNYLHHGTSHQSGRSYGIEFYHWNSRHKIENNIVRETRHSIIFEGGGSGCAVLYNYTDDNWEAVDGGGALEYDDEFLSEDQVGNHGAHPYMNLWEGNYGSCFWADYTQGSGSHSTVMRNWYSGRQSSYTLGSVYTWCMIDIETYNKYYNLLGNILGNSTMTSGTVIDDNDDGPLPTMMRFGRTSNTGSYSDTEAYSTAIVHGNYDYVSDSQNDWADADHDIPDSLYYSSKPSYFGTLDWPPYTPDAVGTPSIEDIPAGYLYVNGEEPAAAAEPSFVSATIPTAGTTIQIVFDESVTRGGGNDDGDWALDMSGGAATLTYSSGDPGTTLTYVISRTIAYDETGTLEYVQPGDGIEASDDAADVISFGPTAVVNDSTDGEPGPPTGTLTIEGILLIGP